MNELTNMINEYIDMHGIRKSWIAEKLGISQQLLQKRLKKQNFTIADANDILNVLGCHIECKIVSDNTGDDNG